MGCGRTNLVWIILLAAFVASCLVSTVSAKDSSQDQAAIEQALRDALPKEGDLPAGLSWSSYGIRVLYKDNDGIGISEGWWSANRFTPNCEIEYRVQTYSRSLQFESAQVHQEATLTAKGSEFASEPYPSLPGGVIAYKYAESPIDYWIYFWKSPVYQGIVTVTGSITGNTECQGQGMQEIKALVRPECERLAKLVYCRLPGSGEGDGICLPTGKFGIKGDVLEVGLFAPILNSKVTITKDGNVFRVVTPDPDDGSYFVPLEPGTYGVIASAPGYISSEGMSEDHVVVISGVNTTYNLRLLEMPPVANNTSVEPPVEYVPYNGKNAATIVIGNEQICNTGAYSRCSGEEGCAGSNVGTSYGLCILNATIGDKEANGTWSVPSQLGSVGCVEMTGVTSIEALKPNEWSYSVPAGTYTIVEYLFVSEVNPGSSKPPCRHWWLKPPKVIDLQPGETMRFVNSAYEWSGDSICTAKYFDCSKCQQFFPGSTLGNGIVA